MTFSVPMESEETMMEWRIVPCSNGSFVAQYGINHKGGETLDYCPGVTMPAFIVYRSARFDTLAEAKRYIKRMEK